MGELQATVEFSVAFGKFYNVDLFQRGFYHVRAYFKPPLRPPMKTEVHLADSSGYEHVYPAQVKEVTTGVSKTFQILYKNEEVTVNDIFLFKVHVLVDSDKIEDTVDSAAFQLVLDLCFSEESADNADSLQVVSSRVLKLHLCANKGLHHHAVIMFDYFHLCAMEVTVHGCLVTLHQPIMNIPKTAKSGWLKGQSAGTKLPLVSLESILFGAVNMNKAIMPAPKGAALAEAMAQARDTHRQMCAALLSSYAGLQEIYQELLGKTPDKYLFRLEVMDTDSRLETLCEAMKIVKTQDEAIQTVTSHLTQLCADLCALWTQFLDMVTTSTPIAQYLSDNNHQIRVQRFCEAFFTVDNPRQSALVYSENSPQGHAHIGALVRNSCYFATLPPVPVECAETDGDATTLPIIFEDRYVATVKEVPSMDLSDVNAGEESKSQRRSSLPFSRKDNKRSSKDKKSGSSSSLNRSESQGSKDGDSTGAKAKRRGSKGRLKFGSKTSQFIKNMKPESLKRPSQSAGLDPVVLLGYRQLEKSMNKKTEPETVGSSSDEDTKLKRMSEPIPLQLLTDTGSKNNTSSLPDIVTLEVLSADSGPQPAKFAWSETNVADTTRETSFTDARQGQVRSEKVTTFDTAGAGPPQPSWSQEQLLTESRLMTTFGSEVHLETVGGPTPTLEHNDPALTSIPTESKIETTFGADGDSPSQEEQSSQDVVNQNTHDDVPSNPSTDVETPISDIKTTVSDVNTPVSDVSSPMPNVNPPITKQPTKSEVSTVEAIPMSGDLGSTNGEAATAKEKLASLMALRKMSFKAAKAELLKQLRFPGQVYSNLPSVQPLVPYFYPDMTDDDGLHLIVCVHGLDGMWFMQKWKKSGSLLQLAFKDHPDPRHTFLYRLSQKPGLALFKNVLLVGSVQDRYVPFHSARIEMCKSAVKDKQFVHIAVLDSEIFIEKFMLVTGLQYFNPSVSTWGRALVLEFTPLTKVVVVAHQKRL
uniref:DUF676 domain-containing protein n=1 Tax=Branchiostoma floridae TaxID=7739 RepID=C3Y176_BRAFL|eukprot:XP_002609606.1 hypothetical protein BRAFLDRAFT_87827 [Branchiostoma floridae]